MEREEALQVYAELKGWGSAVVGFYQNSEGLVPSYRILDTPEFQGFFDGANNNTSKVLNPEYDAGYDLGMQYLARRQENKVKV